MNRDPWRSSLGYWTHAQRDECVRTRLLRQEAHEDLLLRPWSRKCDERSSSCAKAWQRSVGVVPTATHVCPEHTAHSGMRNRERLPAAPSDRHRADATTGIRRRDEGTWSGVSSTRRASWKLGRPASCTISPRRPAKPGRMRWCRDELRIICLSRCSASGCPAGLADGSDETNLGRSAQAPCEEMFSRSIRSVPPFAARSTPSRLLGFPSAPVVGKMPPHGPHTAQVLRRARVERARPVRLHAR